MIPAKGFHKVPYPLYLLASSSRRPRVCPQRPGLHSWKTLFTNCCKGELHPKHRHSFPSPLLAFTASTTFYGFLGAPTVWHAVWRSIMEIPAFVNPIRGESQLIRPGFASINAMMISTSSTVVSLEIAQKTLYKLSSHRSPTAQGKETICSPGSTICPLPDKSTYEMQTPELFWLKHNSHFYPTGLLALRW